MELQHHGIKGQKWGVRRFQNEDGSLKSKGRLRYKIEERVQAKKESEAAYRDKLKKITSKRSNVGSSDARRFEYRNRSLASRVTRTASTMVASMVIQDAMTGNFSRFASMDKKQLTRVMLGRLTNVAASTTAIVALKDHLAKSAAKRYDDNGKRIAGNKKRRFSKEDAVETSIAVGVQVAPVLSYLASRKVESVMADRQTQYGKQWANRNLYRIADTHDQFKVIAELDGGVDVLGKMR